MFELVCNLAKVNLVLTPDSFSIRHGYEFAGVDQLVDGYEVEQEVDQFRLGHCPHSLQYLHRLYRFYPEDLRIKLVVSCQLGGLIVSRST